MRNILKAIRDELVRQPLVRDRVEQRIFDGRVPQSVFSQEHITLARVNSSHIYDVSGELSVVQALVQIDLYSHSPAVRDELAELVRKRLSGIRGEIGNPGDADSLVFVLASTIERDDQIEEPPQDGSDNWMFRRSVDYLMTHEQ